VARPEAYLRAKFHLDPSNRLATVHERHRQTGQSDMTGQDTPTSHTDRQDITGQDRKDRTDNGLIA